MEIIDKIEPYHTALIRLLDKHEAYEKYDKHVTDLENPNYLRAVNLPDVLSKLKSKNDGYRNAITACFGWNKTPEGDYYWRKIHIEWIAICYSIENPNVSWDYRLIDFSVKPFMEQEVL